MTKLSRERQLVREVVGRYSSEARQLMKSAKDYHLSVFTLDSGGVDDVRLMALH